MALGEVQGALARLFTDAEARAAFARDPLAAGRALGLDANDARILGDLASCALDRFADGLQAKRALDVRKLLPLTSLALGEAFGPRLRRCLAAPPPGAVADALALVAALALEPDRSAPWVRDLALYEGAFIEVRRRRFALRLRRFRYPVLAIAAALERGERVGAASPRWGMALWARLPGGALVYRHWRLSPLRA